MATLLHIILAIFINLNIFMSHHLVRLSAPRRLRHRVRDGPDQAVKREVRHELFPFGRHISRRRAEETQHNRQDVYQDRLLDVETNEPAATVSRQDRQQTSTARVRQLTKQDIVPASGGCDCGRGCGNGFWPSCTGA